MTIMLENVIISFSGWSLHLYVDIFVCFAERSEQVHTEFPSLVVGLFLAGHVGPTALFEVSSRHIDEKMFS